MLYLAFTTLTKSSYNPNSLKNQLTEQMQVLYSPASNHSLSIIQIYFTQESPITSRLSLHISTQFRGKESLAYLKGEPTFSRLVNASFTSPNYLQVQLSYRRNEGKYINYDQNGENGAQPHNMIPTSPRVYRQQLTSKRV